MNKRQAKRLYNVAVATLETKNPKRFSMSTFVHPCGTPACALGNYGARSDLQRQFKIIKGGDYWPGYQLCFKDNSAFVSFENPKLVKYFGTTLSENAKLFSVVGCNEAETPKAAYRYIIRFLEKKGFRIKDLKN